MILGLLAAVLGAAGLAFGILVIAYATFMLPPTTPIPVGLVIPLGLGLGAVFAFLAFAKPYAAVLVAFFTIPFEYLTVLVPAEEYGSGGLLNYITLVKLMFGAIIATGVLRIAITKNERPLRSLWWTPIPLLLALFYAMCWMSLANAKRIPAFVTNMMSMGSGLIAFFILMNLLTTKERLFRFMKVVFYAYIFISLMGIYEAVTRTHVLKTLGFPLIERPWTQNPSSFRICGPSGDPDYYAISVIFGLMVTFAVAAPLQGAGGAPGRARHHHAPLPGHRGHGLARRGHEHGHRPGRLLPVRRFRHKLLVGVVAVATLAGGFVLFSVTVSAAGRGTIFGRGPLELGRALGIDPDVLGHDDGRARPGDGLRPVRGPVRQLPEELSRPPPPGVCPEHLRPARRAERHPHHPRVPGGQPHAVGRALPGHAAERGTPRCGTWPSASSRWRCRSGCSP